MSTDKMLQRYNMKSTFIMSKYLITQMCPVSLKFSFSQCRHANCCLLKLCVMATGWQWLNFPNASTALELVFQNVFLHYHYKSLFQGNEVVFFLKFGTDTESVSIDGTPVQILAGERDFSIDMTNTFAQFCK